MAVTFSAGFPFHRILALFMLLVISTTLFLTVFSVWYRFLSLHPICSGFIDIFYLFFLTCLQIYSNFKTFSSFKFGVICRHSTRPWSWRSFINLSLFSSFALANSQLSANSYNANAVLILWGVVLSNYIFLILC